MPTLNPDTHVLVHALAGNLRPEEETLLSVSDWGISAIVLWELAKLVQLGRLSLDLDDAEVVAALRKVHVWPITSPSRGPRPVSTFAATRPTS